MELTFYVGSRDLTEVFHLPRLVLLSPSSWPNVLIFGDKISVSQLVSDLLCN